MDLKEILALSLLKYDLIYESQALAFRNIAIF